MCDIQNNPAKRVKVASDTDGVHRPASATNGFRAYSNIVYPAAEAFVSQRAPDFHAPGDTVDLQPRGHQ